MIKIPLPDGWDGPGKAIWREVCAYLNQNVAPVSPTSVMTLNEENNYRFFSTPLTNPCLYWFVERTQEGLTVSARPIKHEMWLALRFGVKMNDQDPA